MRYDCASWSPRTGAWRKAPCAPSPNGTSSGMSRGQWCRLAISPRAPGRASRPRCVPRGASLLHPGHDPPLGTSSHSLPPPRATRLGGHAGPRCSHPRCAIRRAAPSRRCRRASHTRQRGTRHAAADRTVGRLAGRGVRANGVRVGAGAHSRGPAGTGVPASLQQARPGTDRVSDRLGRTGGRHYGRRRVDRPGRTAVHQPRNVRIVGLRSENTAQALVRGGSGSHRMDCSVPSGRGQIVGRDGGIRPSRTWHCALIVRPLAERGWCLGKSPNDRRRAAARFAAALLAFVDHGPMTSGPRAPRRGPISRRRLWMRCGRACFAGVPIVQLAPGAPV